MSGVKNVTALIRWIRGPARPCGQYPTRFRRASAGPGLRRARLTEASAPRPGPPNMSAGPPQLADSTPLLPRGPAALALQWTSVEGGDRYGLSDDARGLGRRGSGRGTDGGGRHGLGLTRLGRRVRAPRAPADDLRDGCRAPARVLVPRRRPRGRSEFRGPRRARLPSPQRAHVQRVRAPR